MKKIISALLIGLALTVSITSVKADLELGESVFVNEYGVKIFKSDYDKLAQLGLTDNDIKIITPEKFDRLINFEIDFQTVETKYVRTVYQQVDGGVNPVQTFLTEEEYLLALQETEEPETPDTVIQPLANSNYTGNNGQDELNTVTLTVSYDGCKGEFGEFYAHLNVVWDEMPYFKEHDVAGMAFTNNITTKKVLYQGIGLPDFNATLFYTLYVEEPNLLWQYVIIEEHPLSESYNYDDTTMYATDEDDIKCTVTLPEDFENGGIRYIYDDFSLTMDVNFYANTGFLTPTQIMGSFSHQYGNGDFYLSYIDLSLDAPYFTYGHVDNYPNFNPPVISNVIMTDIVDGHDYQLIGYGETSHYLRCINCGYLKTEPHHFGSDVCTVCGYVSQIHSYTILTPYDEDFHTATCICGASILQPHSYIWYFSTRTHYQKCSRCLFRAPTTNHTFVTENGVTSCSQCGYVKVS